MAKHKQIHRVRFVDYVPKAISAVAFDNTGARLALARENSDVEIWNVENGWHQETRMALPEAAAVRNVVWSRATRHTGQRLFVSGLGGSVFELDLVKLCAINVRSSYGGAVWCMAINNAHTLLAVGCEDGGIRLFTVEEGALEYKKSFPATTARILSLAWHYDDELLYSGGADSTIRRWNVKTSQNTSRMMVENYGGEATMIWTLVVLRDLTVISGDSLGHVQIWEGTHGTLSSSFSKHTADVLTLAVSPDENQIFASGIDNQIMMLQKTSKGKWVYTQSRRPHTHDVKAMAFSIVSNTGMNVLVTGGVDTKLCWYDTSNFQTNPPHKIPPFPQRITTQLAPEPRLLLIQNDYSIDLWQLAAALSPETVQTAEVGYREVKDGQQTRVLQLKLKGAHKLVCSALSADGKWLACSDTEQLKLFAISCVAGRYVAKKLVLPTACVSPAFRLVFSPNSNMLILAAATAEVKVLNLNSKSMVRVFSHHREGVSSAERRQAVGSHFKGPSAVCSLAISGDGQWLASGDLNNHIHVFNLDNSKYYCSLPALDSMHTVFSFHPSSCTLVVACTSNRFHIFDLEERKICDWSVEFGHQLPHSLLRRQEKIVGIVFDPAKPNSIILHSHAYFCVVDLDKPLQSFIGVGTKKRKLDTAAKDKQGQPQNFRFVHRYKPLTFMGYAGLDELVVVETPWLKVMQHFPDMLYRPRYGT